MATRHSRPGGADRDGTRPGIDAGNGHDDSRELPGTRNQLSGTVIGPSIQAGAVHGDIHLHAARPTVPTPRQIPPGTAHFTGREAELARLERLASQGSARMVVLTGIGGVGKTSLAVAWAQRVPDRYADGQLYANLGAFGQTGPADPGVVLGMFLRALGVSAQAVPAGLAEQVAMYRSATHDRSLLVLADDAWSAAQAAVLRPASESSLLIVTSRMRLTGLLAQGAELIEVGPLEDAEAVTLLGRTVGAARVEAEDSSARTIARICGGLPIALCVAGARLAGRPRLSLRRMVEDLSTEDDRLNRLSTQDGDSVSTVFDASYRSLHPFAASLYRRLSLHPGPDFGLGPVAVALSGGGGHHAGADPEDLAGALVAASLLQEVEENRFRLHDLLRVHAKRMLVAEEPEADRDDLRRSYIEWYRAGAARADAVITPYRQKPPYRQERRLPGVPDPPDRPSALDWLERERVNLLACGRSALEHGYHELAWHVSYLLWPLFLIRKHHRDRMDADQWGLAAAEAWGPPWPRAVMHKRLGRSYTIAGDPDQAERHLRAAVALYEEAGDAPGVIDAREGLATLYRETGRGPRAVELYREVLDVNRSLGDGRRVGLTLINLGTLLNELGGAAEALDLLCEAGDLLRGRDPYNEVRAGIGLARAYLLSGDLASAEPAAAEAARRMRGLGSDFELADALVLLGDVTDRRGDRASAVHHYRSALDIYRGLGSKRAEDLAARLGALPGEPVPPEGAGERSATHHR